ncbi:bifunctional enoyl-CoA hydratase/phosphate acetyltransferase [Verticiella sediminum]|uniref:bifunctional enoyl-CoA hydratase/phosphate acetyltransferase n=1 Tax=Verticiella sediminum TaxID=1247510 RepID=UPI001FEBB133|nr:bifunctional enoyl-CoA hydratase/phosphate acetyltransferase [Verticiella sediminum]
MKTGLPAGLSAEVFRGKVFDELAVGESAELRRTLTPADIQLFVAIAGQTQPAGNTPDAGHYAALAHGMWAAALVAALLGTRLPGPGTVYEAQALDFLGPLAVGDTLTVRVAVLGRDAASRTVRLSCTATNQHGQAVLRGEARVRPPGQPVELARADLPALDAPGSAGLQDLLARARRYAPVRTAVVHPCDALSLSAAFQARQAGLIDPVLVGPAARIGQVAREAGLSLDDMALDDVPHSHAAAARAAELAGQGRVGAIMKGSLHTDELMAAILATTAGLRTERRVSHCFLMHTPAYPRPFIITDAAINIAPGLHEKADIVRNAITLAQAIGVARPRVAILAAVETVNPAMPATLDAAALCKMADRGQITGAVLDGPLAFDNAVSAAAARVKGIVSEVAGQADILVVPDLESGNMLAKQLEYLGGAASAGVVLGARIPIMLTSRADPAASRLASCALAVLLAQAAQAPAA